MTTSNPVCAVLFDLDGTLLDTAPDMANALNALRVEEGLDPLPYSAIRPHVSHGAVALVKLGFPDPPPAAFESLRQRFLDLYRGAIAVHTQLFDGMEQVLGTLEQRGVRWGVVTNKAASLAEPLLRQLQLLERSAIMVGGDTTVHRKPHPEPLLYAARQIGVEPSRCVYVGDAERDAVAARDAGMRMIVAMFGYISEKERPHEWPAQAWANDPLDILAYLKL